MATNQKLSDLITCLNRGEFENKVSGSGLEF